MAFHLPLLHYDTTVPLSMFSPLFLASLLTLVSSEAAIKLLNRWFVYHVGFAANSIEVFQNSILVSLICCIVYTQCGTSSSSVLETLITPAPDPLDKTRHAMCAFFFSGHTNSHSKNLPTVLVLWSTAMSMLTLNFALERLTGYRGLFAEDQGKRTQAKMVKLVDTAPLVVGSPVAAEHGAASTPTKLLPSPGGERDDSTRHSLPSSYISRVSSRMQAELLQPTMLDMVSWYALAASATAVDFLIHLKLFLGRFDMRTLQAALPQSSHYSLPLPVRHTAQAPVMPSSVRSAPASTLDFATLQQISSFPSSPSSSSSSSHSSSASPPLPPATSHIHPHHLDSPFFYSHLASESELWFDWMSDCGDGFNPSYQVARMLAQPHLRVSLRRRHSKVPGLLQLPRAKVLLLGGDLAYPSPTPENYEGRFFRTFQCALPPPIGYDPAAISYQKPLGGLDRLKDYEGPQVYLIPGNHDWFDGLQTFLRYICARDWLGGWLMPQEKSWFALQLPHGWWVFALDNALNNDIDPIQFQYFARLAALLADGDRVILCYHEPDWVINAHEKVDICQNIAYLQSILQGKVVLKLAGDLHHYTRHMPADPTTSCSTSPPATTTSTTSSSPTPLTFTPANTPSEVDLWQWWNPVSWCRSIMTGRAEYNSRVFLEDVMEDIAPEVNGPMSLVRTQSLPLLDAQGGAKDMSGGGGSKGEPQSLHARPHSRISYSLVDSPPPSPPHSVDSSPVQPHSRRVHVVLPSRSPPISPLPWTVSSPHSPLSPAVPLPGARLRSTSPPASLPHSMQDWDVTDVCRWLTRIGLPHLIPTFRSHDIDGKLLCRLDDDDLVGEMAVEGRLARKKVLAERDARLGGGKEVGLGLEVGMRGGGTVLPDPLELSPAGVRGEGVPAGVWKDVEERKEEAVAGPPAYSRSSTEHVPSSPPYPRASHPPLDRSESTLQYERVAFSPPTPDQRQPPILIVSGGGGAFLHGTHTPSAAPIDVRGDAYVRTTSYPSISTSRAYALLNIFGFRKRNWRFDIFGGGCYFLLVSSVLPLCHLESVLEAATWVEVAARFVRLVLLVHIKMLEETWLSLSVFVMVWVGFVVLAEASWPMWKRLIVGTLHCFAHSIAAFSALVLLEACVEVGLKRQLLGHHDSLLSTFMATFPSAAASIALLDRYTYGCSTSTLQLFSTIFDVPEGMASLKTKMCAAYPSHLSSAILGPRGEQPQVADVYSALLSLSRWQILAYYVSTGLYLWVLATSLVSFVFGSYLYLMSAFLNAHATPAFSSLRVEGYKNFIRFHLTKRGELEVFVLGMDRCPRRWEVDPLWGGYGRGTGEEGGEGRSWKWTVPSVLRAVKGEPDGVRLVDYLVIRPNKSEGTGGEGEGTGGEREGGGKGGEERGGVREVGTTAGTEEQRRMKDRGKPIVRGVSE